MHLQRKEGRKKVRSFKTPPSSPPRGALRAIPKKYERQRNISPPVSRPWYTSLRDVVEIPGVSQVEKGEQS